MQEKDFKKSKESSTSSAAAEKIACNEDLLTEILIHLPAKSLFRFKLVSKNWLSLISSSVVSSLWKPKSTSGLFIREFPSHINQINFTFIPLDSEKQSNNIPLEFIKHPVHILQSCNGLLFCCSTETIGFDRPGNIYYICNPLTKQFTTIPRPHCKERTLRSITLAVDFSKSHIYKVVAVINQSHERYKVSTFGIEIYSSDTRIWRPIGQHYSPENASYIIFQSGVYLNSAIHWPSFRSRTSLYFDIDKQHLKPMPMPPTQGTNECRSVRYFGVSNGHLHLIAFPNIIAKFDVFEMENDYSNWFVKYRVDLDTLAVAFPEITRVQMNVCSSKQYNIDVLSLLRGEDEQESFLLFHSSGKAISYNLINGTFGEMCDLQFNVSNRHHIKNVKWLLVHQYVETPFWV